MTGTLDIESTKAALKANGGPLATRALLLISRLQAALAQRSQASHNHEFAEVKELHDTLPESLQFAPYAASPEALRKHALIVTGYCDVSTVDAGSKAAAERVAAFTDRYARALHGYAITKTEGPLVLCCTPHSQSMRAMGKAKFQESKTAVLNWIKEQMEIAT